LRDDGPRRRYSETVSTRSWDTVESKGRNVVGSAVEVGFTDERSGTETCLECFVLKSSL